MSVLPWIKFYPSDWVSSTPLRGSSLAARGLWIEMLCIMHDAEPYGHLLINGRQVTMRKLAALVGAPEDEVRMAFDELASEGVVTFANDGTPRSDRMIKDEARRVRASADGKKGGNPSLGKGSENSDTHNLTLEDLDKRTLGDADNGSPEGTDKANDKPRAHHAPTTSEARGQRIEEDPSSLRSEGAKVDKWTEICSIEEPGKRAWAAAIFVLMDQGGKSDGTSRGLIGKINKEFSPTDAELFEAAASVRKNGTGDPGPLLRKTVEGIVSQRGERTSPQPAPDEYSAETMEIYRQKIRDWQADRNDWPPARGPQPDTGMCWHIPPQILAEFGYGLVTDKADDTARLFE